MIKKGLELRQKGQDEAALQEFSHAYQVSSSARALAQIALAEQALGHWVEAEKHLTEALKHSDEPWISRNKKHLNQSLYDIQGHLGSLELSGDVQGAMVKVNGIQIGNLPLLAPVRVPSGSVAVEVQAVGYLPIFRTVEVAARESAREQLIFVAVKAAPNPVSTVTASAAQPTGSEAKSDPEKPLAHSGTWGTRQTFGVIVGVVAVGSLATGIAFSVLHETKAKTYNKQCFSSILPSDCQSQYNTINTDRTLYIVGYAGAAVLGGLATYLLLSGPSANTEKVAATETGLRLHCGPTAGLGVLCAGRF
jgi:hypothetical protein